MLEPESKLFKFLNQKHAQSMIEHGVVRIGTPAEYRVPDGLIGARSDMRELTTHWRPGKRIVPVDRNHPFIKETGLQMPEGKTINLAFEEGSHFNVRANAFMYCTSAGFTQNMAERMADEFGCDACVCINHANNFAQALGRHPVLRSYNGCGDEVTYKKELTVSD